MAKKKTTPEEGAKASKVDPNVIIAVIGAITTIAVAAIPFLLSRSNEANAEPPTSTPLVITATTIPDFPTEMISPTATFAPTLTETSAPTFTPTNEPPTATATRQIGIFNAYLANSLNGTSVNTFKPDPNIYIIFDVNDPTGQNIATIRWSVVKVTGYKADAEISRSTHRITENRFGTGFKPLIKLPGKYKVELFLNENIAPDQTIEFDVIP
ncbi:MAG: hypothetical protein HY863_19385 [Chloroflexi bacterium]|nr:hypothetical protein [Chloroflexota bacterium]